MVDSTDLAQVLAEADDIARSVAHKLTSAHLLLSAFTVPNRAQLLLKERGIDEDVVLGVLQSTPKETEGLVRELLTRARDIAASCGSNEADCLHLLIAVTRMKECLAHELLARAGLEMSSLRNTALSYYLGGSMPRRLQHIERARTPALGHAAPGFSRAAPQAKPRTLTQPEPEPSDEPDEAPAPAAAPEPKPRAEPAARPTASPYDLEPKTFPWLSSLGRNLSALAAQRRFDPVIGREKEIDEVVDILGKRRTNNPCLVGEPGVGKTAVVEGVAQALVALGPSHPLGQKVIVELDMASLVAGTQLRGSFSEKLTAIQAEVKRSKGRVIVFIDELHTLVGAGATGEGSQDAANELKSALSRGEFPCIGATTHDEFRKHIQKDPALERRFTPVLVREPTVPQTVCILQGIAGRYEEHHGVRYSPEALEAAAQLAARYVSDRYLPDKAISIMDLAGSRSRREGRERVEPADVARIVGKLAGIPEERLLLKDSERLLRLEQELSARVIGHAEVISKVARVIRRNYAGFSSRRPMGSFLFLGPTGVGKSELAKVLAEVLFGSRDALVRIDMSELSEAHGSARLIGAPPGYVGHDEAGQLTEPVRKRPSSVVLLDEIEKAHRDASMLLLQVLEEGRLTDGRGRHIDFSNTVVVLTSNLGAEAFSKSSGPMGFGASGGAPASGNHRAVDSARGQLPPELWNRIDEKLVFSPLGREETAKIAALLLCDSSERLKLEKGISFTAPAEVVDYVLEHGGFDPSLGARPMRQAIQRLIEGPLAERILAGELSRGDVLTVSVGTSGIDFQRG